MYVVIRALNSVWLECHGDIVMVVGSNPIVPTLYGL